MTEIENIKNKLKLGKYVYCANEAFVRDYDATEDVRSLITTIESQQSEIEQLQDMKIHRMKIEKGSINFSIGGEAGLIFASSLIKFYEDNGGKNFFVFDVERNGMHLSIAIENKNGELTVAKKLEQQERTIQSQKEEIEKRAMIHNDYRKTALKRIAYQETQLESQKAITELTVKGLQFYASFWNHDVQLEDVGITSMKRDRGELARSTLSKIERLQHDQT